MTLPDSLLALFSAARDTEAPTFPDLIDRLVLAIEGIDIRTLQPTDIQALTAHMDGLITHYQNTKNDAATQLTALRTGAALQAYKR